jgi:glucosamine 6-phosphate synthetase-like amidotransferase/phosphosugar isomerase protein
VCGIFGFMLKKPVPMTRVFRVLERLEVSQYDNEQKPVGGYGAGLAVLLDDGDLVFDKVGKVSDFPARSLADLIRAKGLVEASVLVAHVRYPSPEFMSTASLRESAQPYVAQSDPALTVVSVHNGKVENYLELRKHLEPDHVLESEKSMLIDSEIIPHYFVEILKETEDVNEALDRLFGVLRGKKNALGLLHIDEENTYIHLLHKGESRGLAVWTNSQDEMIFCSRTEPLIESFGDILKIQQFHMKIHVKNQENTDLRLTFPQNP